MRMIECYVAEDRAEELCALFTRGTLPDGSSGFVLTQGIVDGGVDRSAGGKGAWHVLAAWLLKHEGDTNPLGHDGGISLYSLRDVCKAADAAAAGFKRVSDRIAPLMEALGAADRGNKNSRDAVDKAIAWFNNIAALGAALPPEDKATAAANPTFTDYTELPFALLKRVAEAVKEDKAFLGMAMFSRYARGDRLGVTVAVNLKERWIALCKRLRAEALKALGTAAFAKAVAAGEKAAAARANKAAREAASKKKRVAKAAAAAAGGGAAASAGGRLAALGERRSAAPGEPGAALPAAAAAGPLLLPLPLAAKRNSCVGAAGRQRPERSGIGAWSACSGGVAALAWRAATLSAIKRTSNGFMARMPVARSASKRPGTAVRSHSSEQRDLVISAAPGSWAPAQGPGVVPVAP